MSDLPDEIVERVAVSIAGLDNFDFEQLHGETRNAYDAMARAALKESGWAEMKEALRIAADYIEMDREGKPRTPGYVLGEIAAAISGRKP